MITDEAPAAGGKSPQITPSYAGDATAAADGNVSSNSNRTDVPLLGFFTLPPELQLRILELSCHASARSADHQTLQPDSRTVLGLLCSSRYLNSLVIPILYAHVHLAYPSALCSFYKAILAHPERGNFVRSLHVGPQDVLCWSHWPLVLATGDVGVGEAYSELYMRSSLHQNIDSPRLHTRFNDEDIAPRWHEGDLEVSLDVEEHHCRGRAVYAALREARRSIDVNPYLQEYGASGQKIGLATWSKRIFELRAALDLYLAAMRRLENDRRYKTPDWRRPLDSAPLPECQAGTCSHRYPRLVFDHHSTTPLDMAARTSGDVFYLTPLQISRHLARPHQNAKTDRFSHPLFFARSGFPFPDTDIDEEGQERIASLLAGPHSQEALGPGPMAIGSPQSSPPYQLAVLAEEQSGGEEWSNVTSPGAGDAYDYLRESARPINASEELIPSPATVGGLLAMGRGIIAMAPNVDNLSLTGYFHRLLCSQAPLASQSLRCLSIGPTLPYWKTTFRSQALAAFSNLEHIRLCVPNLTADEIDLIAGEDAALKRLRHVQWEMVEADEPAVISQPSLASFKELVRCVEETDPATSSHASSAGGKRTRECYEASDLDLFNSLAPSPPGHPLPLQSARSVQILAHPDVMPILLDQALSPYMSTAWSEGRCWSESSDAPHRIHILESEASQTTANWRPSDKVVNQLYSSSKRWWEESAFRGGFRGWGCEEQEGRQAQ